MKIFRWKAIGTLAGAIALFVLMTWLFLDTIVRRGIEKAGELVVGAKVELASAHVRLGAGQLVLRGLQVANPRQPMENLLEASDMVAGVNPLPLLEKKLVIDSLIARGVRFDTPRQTSGALKKSGSTSSAIAHQVTAWAEQIRIPSFSLEGLGRAIELPPLNVDSLRTVQQARAIVQFADTARRGWEAELKAIDPRPKIDSGKALVERLRGINTRSLGVQDLARTVQTTKASLNAITGTLDRVRRLERSVDSGVARMRAGVGGLDDARRGDYGYALGLLKLPSLDAPDLSPALFGVRALDRMQAVLYWVRVAERYVPPGLAARFHEGPSRARMAGTTVAFPRERGWPQFLLRYAALELSLGGEGAAAGAYQARLTGLTTEPTIYGQPTRLVAQRTAGRIGPRDARLAGVLDHVRAPVRDSVAASVTGFALPSYDLPPLRARAGLGDGITQFTVLRHGGDIDARWLVRSTNVAWQRLADSGGAGASRDVDNLLWRIVNAVKDVEIETRLHGALDRPALSVRSNLGTEVARGLRKEIGAQVARAEQVARARVDSAVQGQVAAAQQRLGAVQNDVQARVAQQRAELDGVRKDLEARLREMTGGIPIPHLPFPH
ncbi:MAG TPA: hypothetical protein VLV16_13085 [Gemmatimonadales bacterium]|nr:hypothetical protein [Gemmatimonadales bacterium]